MDKEIPQYIPYGKQTVTDDDISSVVEVLKSPFLTQGPVIKKFEDRISKKTNSKYSLSFNSATSALHIACLSLGLGKGDWLWTSPTTFVASANCGRYCGANVDFVDINPLTGLIDIEKLSLKLKYAKNINKLPKILIPVHLAGTSCNMSEIKKLSDIYGFDIIEDASHALGGKYKGKPVGCCEYSRICVFSCHPVKIITTGEGGIITTNDKNIFEKMEKLRSHGITKKKDNFLNSDPAPWHYEQQDLGFNYRITDIQCALGLSQLERLEEIVLERNSLLERYRKLLHDLPLKLMEIPKDVFSAVHLGIIRFLNYDPLIHKSIFKDLKNNGIGVQIHYIPVHLQPYYKKFGFKEGDFPNSESYAKNSFSLPLYPGISSEIQEYVVTKLKESCKKYL